MKTDVLGETMFIPAVQLFTVPPCNLKYLHLPDINIKHHGTGEPPLLVTAGAVDHECLVEMVTNEGVGGLRLHWQMTKSSHMPVVYEHAYLFKGFP